MKIQWFPLSLTLILELLVFVWVFSLTFVNIEYIYQFDLSNTYSMVYFVYFLLGIFGLLWMRMRGPKNTQVREELQYTFLLVFLFSLVLIPGLVIHHHFMLEHVGESNLYLRSYGKIAFLYFALALSMSPLLRFVKHAFARDIIITSRKVFGILSFLFFLKHGLEYFALEYIFQSQYHQDVSYFQYVYENMLVRYDALSGVIAGILMLVLGLTSNKVSMLFLGGRLWKTLQSLAYPAFLISIIHIAVASRFDGFYSFLIVLVVALRTAAYVFPKKVSVASTTTKYICIPCGYIYDENVGDPDGGIEPGTKFEDIPDDWRCPVCGVSKADFEPYEETENTIFGGYMGTIISYKMLTADVLELGVELDTPVDVLPGQYAVMILQDFDGEFSRSYSLVYAKGKKLTFGIKLQDTGRGGRALKRMKLGDTLKIKGIYGDFVLRTTPNPKVFVATGTGLSPIIHMLTAGPLQSKENQLFFGVQSYEDVFYESLVQSINGLQVEIYLSREEREGYKHGRMDLSKMQFSPETEFYICGNPGLVAATKECLEQAGYTHIFFEKFN